MSQPDLARRIDRAEQDVTAVADTVVDIKETVDEHTATLAEHGRQLATIQETQREHGRLLARIADRLDVE